MNLCLQYDYHIVPYKDYILILILNIVLTFQVVQIYVHILNWRDKRISLPIGKIGVRAASFVENGKPVMFESTDDGIELNMEPEDLTEWVTVIPLDIESALN